MLKAAQIVSDVSGVGIQLFVAGIVLVGCAIARGGRRAVVVAVLLVVLRLTWCYLLSAVVSSVCVLHRVAGIRGGGVVLYLEALLVCM